MAPTKKKTASKKNKSTTAGKKQIENNVSYFLIGTIFLGVFCVLAGLGLMVAANWAIIPASVKMTTGIAGLALALFYAGVSYVNQKSLSTEVGLFLSFVMFGGNIALIQQIYHLNILFFEGAFLWAALSLPLLFFTKKTILPFAWGALAVSGIIHLAIEADIGYVMIAALFFLAFLTSHIVPQPFKKNTGKSRLYRNIYDFVFWGPWYIFNASVFCDNRIFYCDFTGKKEPKAGSFF